MGLRAVNRLGDYVWKGLVYGWYYFANLLQDVFERFSYIFMQIGIGA